MNNLTETTFRNILSLDPEITSEQVEKFLDALDPKRNATPLLQVIRYQEAMQLLSCSRYIIKRLIRAGYLTRVYGSGKRFGIGITAESYHRFINTHSRKKIIVKETPFYSGKRKRIAEREQAIRKIRWSYHFNSSTTRTEKYEAVARLLSSNKKISKSAACLAAGIPVTSYSSFLSQLSRHQSERSKRLAKVEEFISRFIPRTGNPPSLQKIMDLLRQHNIKTSKATIAHILDSLGYNRPKVI